MRDEKGRLLVERTSRHGHQGLTLVELLVTLSIVVILLMVAVPNVEDAAINSKLRAQSNAFLASLQLARSEAIKRNGRVVICKSPDGIDCATSGGWEQGWIVFNDVNNDANRAGDASDSIIERHQPLPTGFSLTGNYYVKNYISFKPTGSILTTNGFPQNGTLTLCRSLPTVSRKGKQIIISSVGRARISDIGTITTCPP